MAVKKTKSKTINAADRIFISIEVGHLIARADGKVIWTGHATRPKAKALGRFLANKHTSVHICQYSGSIDFPVENGGTRVNFRVAIAEGYGIPADEVFDPVNGGERP